MFCVFCGNNIKNDSLFCPYCGKKQFKERIRYCSKCGTSIEVNSAFCPYCGTKQELSKDVDNRISVTYKFPKVTFKAILTNRFFIWYILWIIVNCLLLFKSDTAYSNYFNSTNVSRDHWLSSDKGIYPEDWLYPFKNIFSGIMGQDPVYVYDISEFILYTIIIPALLSLCMYKRTRIFKTKRASDFFYWVIWYCSIWMIVVFPMGLLGLDFLGWSFMMGGLIVGIYSYKKTFAKLYGK